MPAYTSSGFIPQSTEAAQTRSVANTGPQTGDQKPQRGDICVDGSCLV